jgi:hypothetical protein
VNIKFIHDYEKMNEQCTVSRILRVDYSLFSVIVYIYSILESLRGKITDLRCAKPLAYRQEKKNRPAIGTGANRWQI